MLTLIPLGLALAADMPEIRPTGYVEVFGQYNTNEPDNGVTHLRGFDNRNGTITVSNLALGALADGEKLDATVVLQIGHAANVAYLGEPTLPGAPATGESDRVTWRNVQQASFAWAAAEKWTVEGGIFLSPIGFEGMAAKDNWNFSRSNLFFGLPFYHTGVRATVAPADGHAVTAAVYNGWNSVADNNPAKSVSAQYKLQLGRVTGSVLYFGGIERAQGVPEGAPWRNDLDTWWQVDASDRISLAIHGNGGFESGKFGLSWWAAGAGYFRARLAKPVWVALRGDVFQEVAAGDRDGTAGSIFWPAADREGVGRVGSGTLTLDWRPVDGLSWRLEGRHDRANADMFFKGRVVDGAMNASDQTTITAAVVAGF